MSDGKSFLRDVSQIQIEIIANRGTHKVLLP